MEVGGALLSRAPGRSIIAAGALNGRVRDGNGCHTPAGGTNQEKEASGTWRPHPGAARARFRPIRFDSISIRLPAPALSSGWSSRGLQGPRGPGTADLRRGLALRCLQRLSLRGVATRRCRWHGNRNTRGRPPPVLSYWGALPSAVLRLRRIRTKLSHDVLNPARVTL